MPRISKSKIDKQYETLVYNVKLYQLKRRDQGDTCYEAAKRLGLPYSTLADRLKSPGGFTLRELQSIANTLNVSIAALLGE